MSRRSTKSILAVAWGVLLCVNAGARSAERIDRHALVARHNVTLKAPDPLVPLSVGNGELAFNADITGLQTFPEYHQQGTPLCTQSQWGWHTLPNPEDYTIADALEDYEVDGRQVPYASGGGSGRGYSPAGLWLRGNPHRLHLGRIGLNLTTLDGTPARIEHLKDTVQTLDLWAGLLSSRFAFDGRSVRVQTVCHPTRDLLAVRIESPLLNEGRLSVSLAFPYGKADWRDAADWNHPDLHTTGYEIHGRTIDLTRTLDADRYLVRVAWSEGGQVTPKTEHVYEIAQTNGDALDLCLLSRRQRLMNRCPISVPFESRRLSTGKGFGNVVGRSISRSAPIPGRPSWSVGWCCRNT
jgi:protein-glucosylgalactosylhydroxylysine glucosidase